MEARLWVMLACICSLAAGADVLTQEESTATLSYPTIETSPGRRYWLKGTYPDAVNLNDALFMQLSPSGTVYRVTAPAHMPLPDPTTCNLVINPVHLADAGNYSTATEDLEHRWYYEVAATLKVWIQPVEPVVSTEPSNLHEGHPVNVTCTLPRLQPGVPADSFIMTWDGHNTCPGSPGCSISSTPVGSDGAESYTLQFTKTVIKADNGATIACSIRPPQGEDRTSELVTLDVKYAPTGDLTIGASNENPELYETVVLACDYTGLAANPPISTVLWSFNGEDVYQDQKSLVNLMVITEITGKSNGNYSCKAGNEVGFMQSKSISLHLKVDGLMWNETVVERGTVTLKYNTTVESPLKRYWYLGQFSSANLPKSDQALFRQDNVTDGPVTRVTAPSYMTVPNPSTFDLVVTGVSDTDAGHYTAITTDERDRPFYKVGNLNVSPPAKCKVTVYTGVGANAETHANAYITMLGTLGNSTEQELNNGKDDNFKRGGMDTFFLECAYLGDLEQISIRHDNTGSSPDWLLDNILVENTENREVYKFPCFQWLEDGSLSRSLPVPDGICQSTVNKNKNVCYWVEVDLDTQATTREKCASKGGELAAINTKATSDFVKTFLNTQSFGWLWIGYNESDERWYDGSLFSWTNYADTEPNDSDWFCTVMHQAYSWEWYDYLCSNAKQGLCQVHILNDCLETYQGEGYMGTRNTTLDGLTCQAWSTNTPHTNEYRDPDLYPDATLEEASNYCRNPSGDPEGPWCYTTDPDVEYSFCDIPLCG